MAEPATIPSSVPCPIYAGDDLRWTIDLSSYPADEWTLKYAMLLESATETRIEIVSTADGTTHSVTVANTVTTNYVPGTYNYVAYVVNIADSSRYTIKRDVLVVRPDFVTYAGDTRSYARQMIDALRSAISGTVSASRKKYSIGGVLIERMDATDQTAWLDYFSALYKSEQEAVGRENDRDTGTIYMVWENK